MSDDNLTPFPDGLGGYIEYAWEGLSHPMRDALNKGAEINGFPFGMHSSTERALASRDLLTAGGITERGRAVVAWARETGRLPSWPTS